MTTQTNKQTILCPRARCVPLGPHILHLNIAAIMLQLLFKSSSLKCVPAVFHVHPEEGWRECGNDYYSLSLCVSTYCEGQYNIRMYSHILN